MSRMPLLQLSVIFLLLTLTGISISKRIFKDSNIIFLIGSGMLFGLLGLLFTAGILSYLFKGFLALTFIYIGFVGLTITLNYKYLNLKNLKLSRQNLLLGLVIISYLFLFFKISETFSLGGDVEVYFGLATSFARGNYPSFLPWQSDFLSSYHMGAFIIEGTIYAITKISIYTIHVFFAFYCISALFLLITGIAKQKFNSLIVLLPATLSVICFAVPVILINGFNNFSINLSDLDKYPQYIDFKGSLAGGSADFLGMYYRNFYPLALSILILALYSLAQYPWGKDLRKKYILSVILLISTISIDESFFIAQLLAVLIFFIIDFYRVSKAKTIKFGLVLLIMFLSLFFLIQNSVRDAIFNPAKESTRFKILLPGGDKKSQTPQKFTLIPGDQQFMLHFNQLEESQLKPSTFGIIPWEYFQRNLKQLEGGIKQSSGTTWWLPNILLTTIILLVVALKLRSRFAIVLSFSALVTLGLSQILTYTFFPPTSLRFIHQGAQLASLGLAFLILDLYYKSPKIIFKLAILFIVILVLGPQILTSHTKAINYPIINSNRNFYAPSREFYQYSYDNIQRIIPYNAHVLFIDNYPLEPATTMVSTAISRLGFFVPIAPPDVKVVSPESSIEWLDASLSLNPPSLKAMKVEYIFIQHLSLKRLINYGLDIENSPHFKEIYKDVVGVLYLVSPDYYNLPLHPQTLQNLISKIPSHSNIYLDKFKSPDIRRGLVLRLAKDHQLIGPGFSAGWDYFLYIETFLPFTYICEAPYLEKCEPTITDKYQPIDYLITEPGKDIREITDINYIKTFETPLAVIWQRSDSIK